MHCHVEAVRAQIEGDRASEALRGAGHEDDGSGRHGFLQSVDASGWKCQCMAALARLIRQGIERNGGWLPFDRFMAMALYAPGLRLIRERRAQVRCVARVG
jgi:hypothetical protein